MHVYRNKTWCDIKEIENRLIDNYVIKWKSTIEKTPKLRTYIMFKDIFEPETYIIKCMSRRRRSLMSQFRTGILPLEIETGRYVLIFDKTLKKKRSDKFLFVMKHCQIEVSKFINEEWSIRQTKL